MHGKTFKAAWTFEVFRKHSVTESSHVKWVVWFFPLNLPKANVIIGVLYCHAAERMLICTYANRLCESSVPSVYLCF